jgi:hypothetical protein
VPIVPPHPIHALRNGLNVQFSLEHTCTFGLFKVRRKNLTLKNIKSSSIRILCEETTMKKVFLLVSTGVLFTILGCSGNSQKAVSKSAPTIVQASAAPASTSPEVEPAAALPIPSVEHMNQQAWRSENVKDRLGNAVTLSRTSSDGKFDLVILQKGTNSFLSFVRHGHWESVVHQPAKGKLMYLRVKFEDGQEKRIEWDELGFGTENLYSVLWSYPAKTDAPIGPALEGSTGDSVGGDQLLVQDMMMHKTMLLEVAPGIMTQFDITGLAHEIEKMHAPKTQPVLQAGQIAE